MKRLMDWIALAITLSAQKRGAGTLKSLNSPHGATQTSCQTWFIHPGSPWVKSMPINAELQRQRVNTFSPTG